MPPYREGYCRLPVAALYRGFDKGQGTLVWRDQVGTLIGSAMVTARFDGIMRVAFDISGSAEVEAFMGEVPIRLVMLPAGLHRLEPYAACPTCDRPVKSLIAKDHSWRCGECHALVNRSALLRSNIRLTEQVADLEAKIGAGRPKGMHNGTYERARQCLQAAKARLGSNSLSADSRYVHIITHHLAAENAKAVKKRIPKERHLPGGQLFTGSLLRALTETFIKNAYRCAASSARFLDQGSSDIIADKIANAARVRPLMLGLGEELSDSADLGGQARTVVEVPFVGDPLWLRVGADKGERLPPLYGQIDEPAAVIRFTWNGSVIDRPALRVQIDETLAVLREQVAYQEASIAIYNASLKSEATWFLRGPRRKS